MVAKGGDTTAAAASSSEGALRPQVTDDQTAGCSASLSEMRELLIAGASAVEPPESLALFDGLRLRFLGWGVSTAADTTPSVGLALDMAEGAGCGLAAAGGGSGFVKADLRGRWPVKAACFSS